MFIHWNDDDEKYFVTVTVIVNKYRIKKCKELYELLLNPCWRDLLYYCGIVTKRYVNVLINDNIIIYYYSNSNDCKSKKF